ncbi:MAG: winged helix-turn-helix transcriptional regulator, partial [Candidatus Lindowbacteria bacterium]|nr:winged helix-turn-helix transcriptional regulator [Candidatus Lindowbacteria bacterium]
NIRRVYIHFFFHGKQGVKDSQILPLIETTLDRSNPREWYYALMDYGATLKQYVPNPNRRSAHYRKQERFEGSQRQVRGMLLKILLKEPCLSTKQIARRLSLPAETVAQCLIQLQREGLSEKPESDLHWLNRQACSISPFL